MAKKIGTLTKDERDDATRALDAARDALERLNQWAADRLSEMESDFEERSERWKESAAGDEAGARIEDFRAWLEGLPDYEIPDVPEEM